MNEDDDRDPDGPLEYKTKSQLKREADALQSLGKNLVELPATRFAAVMAKLELPDALREALIACRAIAAHGGRRRQLQYIGKLMRGIDAEPIRRALGALEGKDRAQKAALHRVEQWRERLIAEGDAALAELLGEFPTADRQQLRQLTMKARKERDAGQSPAAARALFRMLRDLILERENHGGHGEEA
jgi:ribosome-associated protein